MAIFNTNEFLRKTFSKTIFGTAALRPEAVCADGFTLSIQASGISSDNFHEAIPYESESILSGLKYNRNDKVTDFHLAYLLNEGRAKNLDSNIYKKREPHVDKLEYEFNKTGDIDFYSGELYLNAIGDVVSGCDWSYKSQKKYRFGNVMNKNWLENISNSELYIAS